MAASLAPSSRRAAAEESPNVEDAAKQDPGVRNIGDDDGRGGFADIPVNPFGAVREGKGVIFAKDCTKDLRRARKLGLEIRFD